MAVTITQTNTCSCAVISESFAQSDSEAFGERMESYDGTVTQIAEKAGFVNSVRVWLNF
jgi:hypothetical protein